MNENTNQTAPKTFDIIDGNMLMAQEYEPLRFDPENCKWLFVCNDGEQLEEKTEEKDEWFLLLVDEFLQETWSGTVTELCNALKEVNPEADVALCTITIQIAG